MLKIKLKNARFLPAKTYIFHLFFSMLRYVFPEEIGAMPYAYAPRSLALVHHWGEPFDKAKWQRLTERVCFHKLTYMKDKVPVKVEGTYYEYILNDNVNENDNHNDNDNGNSLTLDKSCGFGQYFVGENRYLCRLVKLYGL